jgi:hypothetical protein
MTKHISFNELTNVLSARYDSEIHETIPVEAVEVQDDLFFQTINENDGVWSLVDGKIVKLPFPEPTQDELDALAAIEKKAQKVKALNSITVTTSTGKVFDGNESARSNMLSALQAAEFLNQTEAGWKLADNSVEMVAVDELKEALVLSIQRAGEIITN